VYGRTLKEEQSRLAACRKANEDMWKKSESDPDNKDVFQSPGRGKYLDIVEYISCRATQLLTPLRQYF